MPQGVSETDIPALRLVITLKSLIVTKIDISLPSSIVSFFYQFAMLTHFVSIAKRALIVIVSAAPTKMVVTVLRAQLWLQTVSIFEIQQAVLMM